MIRPQAWLAVILSAGTLVGCYGIIDGDPTLYLTGTEQEPLSSGPGGGGPTCPAGKVLICHIPPGNPANAHTICVGQPAEKAHAAHHGDSSGACGAADGGTAPVDAGASPAPAPVDAGPTCLPLNSACGHGQLGCCAGLACVDGLCTQMIP
ncbi:MAG: hypothetical protein HYZ28_24780 [Myxococcales bacterium]|nr:hypothetical protein [Myxococcales bacterium]